MSPKTRDSLGLAVFSVGVAAMIFLTMVMSDLSPRIWLPLFFSSSGFTCLGLAVQYGGSQRSEQAISEFASDPTLRTNNLALSLGLLTLWAAVCVVVALARGYYVGMVVGVFAIAILRRTARDLRAKGRSHGRIKR